MKKSISIVAVGLFLLSGCGSSDVKSKESSSVENSSPVPSYSIPTYLDHVSDVSCKRRTVSDEPDSVVISFTLQNKGSEAALYSLGFAVLDSSSIQTGSFGVAYGEMMGPLSAGAVGKYSDNHGLRSGVVPVGDFSCRLLTVSRIVN